MNNLQKALLNIADEIDEVAEDANVTGEIFSDINWASSKLRRVVARLDADDEDKLDPREALEQFSEKRQVVVEESAEQAGFCERCGTQLSHSMLGGSSCHMCGWNPEDESEI